MNNQPEETDIDNLTGEQIISSTTGKVPAPDDNVMQSGFLDQLSFKQRSIFALKELGLEYWEIEDWLGIPQRTIERELSKVKEYGKEYLNLAVE